MMSVRLSLTFSVVLCLVTSNCWAQFGGGNTAGGNTGRTGGQTGGFTGGTNTGGFAGGAGNTQGFNTGQSLGTSNLNAADGTLSQTVGQNAFVGQGNQGFVGSRNAGTGSGQTVGPQFSNLQQNNNRSGQTTTTTTRKEMRPRIRIGFASPLETPAVRTSIRQSLLSLPGFVSPSSHIEFEMNEAGVVSLTGTASSLDERQLLEAYVRMEPGVRGVKNELIVAPQLSIP